MQILGVDPDFLETYGIDLIAGRNVGPDFVRKNSAEFVLNETAVQRLGWGEFGPEGAIGKRLRAGNRRGTVIGVVKDFHYSSFRDAIPPLVMMNWSRIALGIRIRPDRVDETLAAVDQTWREFFSQPLQLKFVDQMWGWNLWRERAQSRAYALLSWTAVLLAGMGVFGMAMYETEQRRREIGVRKVLGATVSGIVAHFWRGHVWLVVVANLVAWPVAYSVLQAWLQEFAYRIPLPATAFLAAGATVGVLFLAVVGTQAARVGLVNPAETLRSE
jgi:putative ABC transport system permease protein